jgi:uncharacterized protein (TIGR03437 family)
VELENNSVFDGGARAVRVERRRPYFFNDGGVLIAAHQDFRSLVTRNQPALPGEILHLYAVGLGPIAPPIETGMPAPSERTPVLADPFECRTGSGPAEVLFGIYQVNVRMPPRLPRAGWLFLACGFPDHAADWHGGSLYAGGSPPPRAR